MNTLKLIMERCFLNSIFFVENHGSLIPRLNLTRWESCLATLAVQMGNCNQTAGGFPGKSLVLYGCSGITSLRQQLEAICAVGSVSQARVIGRNQERRERFASRMSERLNLEVAAVDSVQDCVSGTDVVALHSGSGAGGPVAGRGHTR